MRTLGGRYTKNPQTLTIPLDLVATPPSLEGEINNNSAYLPNDGAIS